MTVSDLETKSQNRLNDADLLYRNKHWEGAIYLCGYSLEFKLKAGICRTLKWTTYKTGEKFDNFKTHNLHTLLTLSGLEDQIIKHVKHSQYWNKVNLWDPELRYDAKLTEFTEHRAKNMIENTKKILLLL